MKFKLIVRNDDTTPEEFESYDLNREKVVSPGQEITVFLVRSIPVPTRSSAISTRTPPKA